MSDWLGLVFFLLLLVGIWLGLRVLSKQPSRTEEEFERGVEDGRGLAGAGFNALHQMLNPEEAKKQIVVTELRQGRYNKKKREGKAGGNAEEEEDDR